MAYTPTNGQSCFPFAVNCRLTKTFFGMPRKCNYCQKMIFLSAGYACQYCSYRCHKRCLEMLAGWTEAQSAAADDGASRTPHHVRLCSLSRLPSGDEKTLSRLLRESELNSNDVDHSDWYTAATPAPLSSSPTSKASASSSSDWPPTWAQQLGNGNKATPSNSVSSPPTTDESTHRHRSRSHSWFAGVKYADNRPDKDEQRCSTSETEDVEQRLVEQKEPLQKKSVPLTEWAVRYEELEIGDCLARGSAVDTFKGRWHGDVTVHRYRQRERFMQDVRALTKIRHENIALFMGACIEPPINMIVITSVRKGDTLYDAIHRKKRRNDMLTTSKIHIAQQIAQGIGYLHAKGILLQGFSSQNVQLEGKVKVNVVNHGGFDSAAKPFRCAGTASCSVRCSAGGFEPKGVELVEGQLAYLSPELISKLVVTPACPPRLALHAAVAPDAASKAADVYAFGTVLYEMFVGGYPMSNAAAETIVWRVGSGRGPSVGPLERHGAVKSLIKLCWSFSPGERPPFTAILKQLHESAGIQKRHSTSEPDKMNKTGQLVVSPQTSSTFPATGVTSPPVVDEHGEISSSSS